MLVISSHPISLDAEGLLSDLWIAHSLGVLSLVCVNEHTVTTSLLAVHVLEVMVVVYLHVVCVWVESTVHVKLRTSYYHTPRCV